MIEPARLTTLGARRPTRLAAVLALLLTTLGAAIALAQAPWLGGERTRGGSLSTNPNLPYDARFRFVRLRYDAGLRGGFRGRGGPGWYHDYPRADVHFEKILKEITLLDTHTEGSDIFGLDEADLMRAPVAYMSEPGGWQPDDKQAAGLRAYLLKGGFIIFDDFRGGDWYNLEDQMRRILPGLHFVEIDGTHPIFHAFFEIASPAALVPPYGNEPPSYWAIFENNDPARRMMAIANRNNDIGEYWEFSDTGYMPVDLSNEAYKFGINYVVYAMTH